MYYVPGPVQGIWQRTKLTNKLNKTRTPCPMELIFQRGKTVNKQVNNECLVVNKYPVKSDNSVMGQGMTGSLL